MALSELTYLPTAFLCAFLLMGLLLAYFVFQVFFGHKLGKMGPWLAVTVSGTVAILSIIVWYSQYSSADENSSHSFIQIIYINWFSLGNKLKVNLGFDLRWIHATMLPLVSSITFLVHLFSVEYMKRDRYNHRFWAYLALFSFAMCGLVLADNFLMLFIFWEIMGLASYFLIGFWFGKTTPAKASQKAFIINRIGDVGFVVALMAMFSSYGNFNLDQIYLATMSAGPAAAFSLENWLIVGGLMLGVAGKSAQFPLQVWLPDAMAGPTPVSSLIHAATMVAAGVFLLVQISILFTLEMRILVIIVGCTTALMAAISALSQTDIKAVLAYSTISQLGFMVAAIGMGASNSAFFHLVTHAFFKCGLFLTAGVVIYRLHRAQDAAGIHYDAQDLRWMGGLRKKMPLTFITYVIFAAALAGLPFTSGFLSKDGILIQAIEIGLAKGGLFWLAPSSLILASLLTAIYITRHGILIFGHSFRAGKQDEFKAVEQYLRPANWKMAIPLLVLASMSLWVVYSPLTPFHGEFGHILHNIQWGQTPVYFKWLPLLFAGVALLGISISIFLYRKGPAVGRSQGFIYQLSYQHFYLNNFYENVIAKNWLRFTRLMAWLDHYLVDGFVNLVAAGILRKDGKTSVSQGVTYIERNFIDRFVNGLAAAVMRLGAQLRGLQTGKLQLYLTYTLLGLLLLLLGLFYFAAT